MVSSQAHIFSLFYSQFWPLRLCAGDLLGQNKEWYVQWTMFSFPSLSRVLYAKKFHVVIPHLQEYLLKPSFLKECSHISGAHSCFGFRLEEFHSQGVSFRLGLAGIIHDPRFLGSLTPCIIYILFFVWFLYRNRFVCGEGAYLTHNTPFSAGLRSY